MRLKEKVALVTGGAHGMGAAEAKLFAKEGARVVVADVRDGDGKAVIDQITSAGGQARFVHLDVTREAEWQQAVRSPSAPSASSTSWSTNPAAAAGSTPTPWARPPT